MERRACVGRGRFRADKGEEMRGRRRDNLHDSESSVLPILPPEFTSAGAGPEGCVLEHHRQPAFAVPPLSCTSYCVAVALGAPFEAEITQDGASRRYRFAPGDVIVLPYGFSLDGAHIGACEFLSLRLHPSVVERAAGDIPGGGRPEIAPRIGAADPLAARMLSDLLRELKAGAGGSYAEALVAALCLHLVRHYSAAPQAARGREGGLPDYVLSGATAFIEDSLGRDLSVAEVARAAGVSPARFGRAFKAATGKAVRQYVDERRVEKAKPLLASGLLAVEEVARQVGFSSSRRFAAAFRRLTGLSPHSYRQQTRT